MPLAKPPLQKHLPPQPRLLTRTMPELLPLKTECALQPLFPPSYHSIPLLPIQAKLEGKSCIHFHTFHSVLKTPLFQSNTNLVTDCDEL